MDIIQALARFRDSIYQWCTTNFNQKVSNTQTVNGFLLEDDIELTVNDIPGFEFIRDDLNTLIEQLSGYTIKMVNDLPSVIDENTIYFVREKYVYILCKDNIFFDVIGKINKAKKNNLITLCKDNIFFDVIGKINKGKKNNLITEKIILATDSYKASLDRASKIGKTKFSFIFLDGKSDLENVYPKQLDGTGNVDIHSEAILHLIHPVVRSPKFENVVSEIFNNIKLRAVKAIPQIIVIFEFLHNSILRKSASRNILSEKLFNEISHTISIAHPVVKDPKIYIIHESLYNTLLNKGDSHSNNISYPVSLLIDEARMPQEIPVSHTTNVFTTLLSYISEGINSKISAFRGFNKENENQKIIINKLFSTEDATLDKTTWQHPVLTEIIEGTNYNDLHVYQAYKASYKNNTLTIK